MDETSYRVSREDRKVCVNFDLRDQENSFIELTFLEEDVLSIINMQVLRKSKIAVNGINGSASLCQKRGDKKLICFLYENGGTGFGTVYYPFNKLAGLLSEAFTILNGDPDEDSTADNHA